MWLLNIAIILIIGLSLWRGARRGLVLVLADLVELGLAALAAALTYGYLDGYVQQWTGLPAALSKLVAFVSVLLLAQFLLTLVARDQLIRTARRLRGASRMADAWGGAIINAGKMVVTLALSLAIALALPLPPAWKEAVSQAYLARALVNATGSWQQRINQVVGREVGETLDFFTVKPKSEEFYQLGYTTNQVQVDEANEWAMLARLNRERTQHGLKPLAMDFPERTVARAHGRDMFARGYFSHVNPEGQDPFDRMHAAGLRYGAAGENLALAPTLDLAHNGLMNSPGHRANILSPDFKRVGIGVINGGRYGEMFVQDFRN